MNRTQRKAKFPKTKNRRPQKAVGSLDDVSRSMNRVVFLRFTQRQRKSEGGEEMDSLQFSLQHGKNLLPPLDLILTLD